MEHNFFYSILPQYRDYFQKQEQYIANTNPETYEIMKSLATVLELPTYQTVGVNSIVDFSSFCTSIVARNGNGTILHARNLDFDFPTMM